MQKIKTYNHFLALQPAIVDCVKARESRNPQHIALGLHLILRKMQERIEKFENLLNSFLSDESEFC
jgi:hypothetical protein